MTNLARKEKLLSKKHQFRAQQLLQHAWARHQAGFLQDAESAYLGILEKYPTFVDAIQLHGLLARQTGNVDLAISRFEQAISIKPDYVEALNNLGDALQLKGRHEEAIQHLKYALTINPGFPEAHYNLANSLQVIGQTGDAIQHYKEALRLNPDFAEAYLNLGNILQSIGNFRESLKHLEKSIELRPELIEAHASIGNIYRLQGNLDKAISHLEQTLKISTSAEVHYLLGITYRELGHYVEDYLHQRQAVNLDRSNDKYWKNLASSLENITFTSIDDQLLDDMLEMLAQPAISPKPIIESIISAIRCHPFVSSILGDVKKQSSNDLEYINIANELEKIPILNKVIQDSSINDFGIESLLTCLRKALLSHINKNKNELIPLEFSVSLALHCYTNEYIFNESEEESNKVKDLINQIETNITQKEKIDPTELIALSSYRPLYKFDWATSLLDYEWVDELKVLIQRQITEPASEIKLKDEIKQLTPIDNSISQSVRTQYEENPYPLWIKPDKQILSTTIEGFLQSPPLLFELNEYDSPQNPEILIAGCGTGMHAVKVVSQFKNAKVLALDLSQRSLAYAIRKTRELGIKNIEFAQADIMELESLKKNFDLIESVGVLHHLQNPFAGWQILTKLLRTNGIMKIGLYSEMARQDVIKCRKYIKDKGYSTSVDDIRRCRQEIINEASLGDPLMQKIFSFRDFYHMSELRDLLFHVQEHRYTIPQIEEQLNQLGLRFLGFELKDRIALQKFKSTYTKVNATSNLKFWHEFETEHPDTFRGMYQFWLQKI